MKVVMGQLNTVGDLQGNTDKVIKEASGLGSHDEPVLLVFRANADWVSARRLADAGQLA